MQSLALAITAVLAIHGLCIMESVREADLNHVGYHSFWTYHVLCRDFGRSPCH